MGSATLTIIYLLLQMLLMALSLHSMMVMWLHLRMMMNMLPLLPLLREWLIATNRGTARVTAGGVTGRSG